MNSIADQYALFASIIATSSAAVAVAIIIADAAGATADGTSSCDPWALMREVGRTRRQRYV